MSDHAVCAVQSSTPVGAQQLPLRSGLQGPRLCCCLQNKCRGWHDQHQLVSSCELASRLQLHAVQIPKHRPSGDALCLLMAWQSQLPCLHGCSAACHVMVCMLRAMGHRCKQLRAPSFCFGVIFLGGHASADSLVVMQIQLHVFFSTGGQCTPVPHVQSHPVLHPRHPHGVLCGLVRWQERLGRAYPPSRAIAWSLHQAQ